MVIGRWDTKDEPLSDIYTLMEEGHRFIEREEWDRALDVYRRAERLDRDHLEVIFGLATITFNLGRFAEGARYWRRCLDMTPSSSEVLVGLAACYFFLRRYEPVVELCERAALLDPQECDAYSYGVAAALALNQYDSVLQEEHFPGLESEYVWVIPVLQ